MSKSEVRALYIEHAQKMESEGSLLESEKLYLQVGEVIFCVSGRSSKHDSLPFMGGTGDMVRFHREIVSSEMVMRDVWWLSERVQH